MQLMSNLEFNVLDGDAQFSIERVSDGDFEFFLDHDIHNVDPSWAVGRFSLDSLRSLHSALTDFFEDN